MAKPTQAPFETLIAPWLDDLYRVAWRLAGNRPDAEDLVQDTCTIACQSFDQLAEADRPDSWLIRVMYNRFIDGTRRRQRSPVVAFDGNAGADETVSSAPGPDELALRDESERSVLRACARLSDTHRVLLSLRAEGYGLAEIERITGISRSVLRARLHRARLSLASHLDEQTQETAALSRLGSKP